jgi:hypothetical protein
MVTGSNPARAVHLLFFFSPCTFDVRQHIPQPIDNCIYNI